MNHGLGDLNVVLARVVVVVAVLAFQGVVCDRVAPGPRPVESLPAGWLRCLVPKNLVLRSVIGETRLELRHRGRGRDFGKRRGPFVVNGEVETRWYEGYWYSTATDRWPHFVT